MIVNLTYFVQIINFLVGYWLLKNFLFKPMLVKIENKNFDNLQAEEKIEILDKLVLVNKNKLIENWHNFYQTKKSINFCKLKPILINQVFEPVESKNNYLTKDHIVNLLLGEIDDK
jgi:hypothetical protein